MLKSDIKSCLSATDTFFFQARCATATAHIGLVVFLAHFPFVVHHGCDTTLTKRPLYYIVEQWSATTRPRPGAGPWGVGHRAVSFSRLNALKHFCIDRRNYFRTFYEKERILVQLLSHKSWSACVYWYLQWSFRRIGS